MTVTTPSLADVFILLNPNAGNRSVSWIIEQIKKDFPQLAYSVSESEEDAKVILGSKIEEYKIFIIVGGDGTINQALPFFVGKLDKIMCVLPVGSGNGFAREMGFINDLQDLVGDILKGAFLKLDVGCLNDRFFVNVAGIGFDGYVADAFKHQKRRGLYKYIWLTIKSILKFRPFKATIQYGDQTFYGVYTTITMANSRQFGNNALIAPLAKLDDGKIDLVLIRPFPIYYYLLFFYKMFAGSLRSTKFIHYSQTNDVVHIQAEYAYAHIDGEPFVSDGNLIMKVLPQAISVLKTKHYSKYADH
ncbi:MAG: diacylglycerol kinase family protein [Saprospiraceae bacterium]